MHASGPDRSKYRDAGRPARHQVALLIRAVEDGYCTLGDIACKLDFGAQEDDDDLVTTPVVSVDTSGGISCLVSRPHHPVKAGAWAVACVLASAVRLA